MSTQTREITQEVIQTFIEGHDPMKRIVNITYSSQDNYVTIYYRDEKGQKCKTRDSFYPFVWATRNACTKLCGGNRSELKTLMDEFGIGVKKLSNTNINGEVIEEFENGYMFMFFAKKPMPNSKFHQFFKRAQNPIYAQKDKNGKEVLRSSVESRQYLAVPPVEQYMISTGRRFFKGYEDYDEVYRMIFDLETEGLDPKRNRINQIGIRTNKGFEKILTIEGNSEEEKSVNELVAIDTFFKIIYQFQPDIITAHNGENFDWNFIIERCNVLGMPIDKISSKYFNGESIRKDERESILKLGGEMEKFRKTIVPNTIVTDSLHAVRRAQAIDSNFLKADLKYSTEYLGKKKPNRVYVPGDKISSTWNDKENSYALNNTNGNWYMITDKNTLKEGYDIVTGKYIVERYLLDDIWECDKVEHQLNTTNFLICKMLPIPYGKATTMGTAGQWKSLMMAWSYENNLAIPMFGESKPFTGGLSRLLKVGFVKDVIKLDYNSLYPSIDLTWGVADKQDLMKSMLNFLEFMLLQREKFKKLKKEAGKEITKILSSENYDKEKLLEAEGRLSLYDKNQLQYKIFCNSYFGSLSAPNVFPWGSLMCGEQTTCIGRQCLRLMISHFSNISEKYHINDDEYNYTPVVGDTDGFNFQLPTKFRYTDETPYVGKGLNREVKEGVLYSGYEADLAEFNDLYMKNFHYNGREQNFMGLGLDEVISSTINFSRKNYADYFPENKFPKDVKLVGNSIKSKKMPTYISKFLERGIRFLLKNDGAGFLEEYYNYIEKIYNYQIPLKDIASKGKIKKSIKEYLEDMKTITKAGRPKSRQAWYELAIRNNLKVDNGDTIYYINTGKTKSQADIKKITRWVEVSTTLLGEEKKDITAQIEKEYKLENKKVQANCGKDLNKDEWISKNYPNIRKEEEIVMNCVLVPQDVLESEEDAFCSEDIEYNTAKYIDAFNKRITPLLVCFKKDIRGNILINNPKDRQYFTEEESKLCSGEPNKTTDQDTYEQLMTMEDKEIKFWTKYNLVPPFIEECGMGEWDDIVNDYNNRMNTERELGIDKDRELYDKALNELTSDDIDSFIENGEIPVDVLKIVTLKPDTMELVSKKYPDVVIGTIYDILDASEKNIGDNDDAEDEQ